MFPQTKMQLWYPRMTSEEKIKTFLNGSNKKANKRRFRNFSIESDISDEYQNAECCTSGDRSIFSSRNQSPQLSDSEETVEKCRKTGNFNMRGEEISDFIDLRYWRKENLCCGTIFRGVYGEVMVDPSLMKPCENRLTKIKTEETE